MKRTATNFLVDAIAFVAFVLLTATGLIERYLLPPGSGRFQSLWGWDRHQWGNLHYGIALVLMAALAAHIILHWNWIVCVVQGRRRDESGWRVALGVVGLLGLLGLAMAPFLSSVEPTGTPGRRPREGLPGQSSSRHEESSSASSINGSMTLPAIEQTTGVPVDVLIRELGLPADVPLDLNLGRLRRDHGFEMEDVRRIVAEHEQEP